MKRCLVVLAVVGAWAVWWPTSAQAVIQAELPLRTMVFGDTELIFLAKITKLSKDPPTMVLVPSGDLKGKAPWERLPVNLKASGEMDTPKLLKRVADDLPVIVFVNKRSGDKYHAMGFTNGTWFSLLGYVEEDKVRWGFVQCEPNFRRTFRGTTDELSDVVKLAVARKKAPPPLDDKAAPGLGAETGEKKKP